MRFCGNALAGGADAARCSGFAGPATGDSGIAVIAAGRKRDGNSAAKQTAGISRALKGEWTIVIGNGSAANGVGLA